MYTFLAKITQVHLMKKLSTVSIISNIIILECIPGYIRNYDLPGVTKTQILNNFESPRKLNNLVLIYLVE